MAAAAPKLPLAIRKEVRDNEEKKTKLLADATTIVGSPVTYNFDLDATYAALEGSSYQARFVPLSLQYLENAIKAVDKAYKDALVKADFDSAWTTHNVALVILPSAKALEELKADKTTVGSSYFRLRLLNGELQVLTDKAYFASNLSDIGHLDLTPIASHAASQSSAPGSSAEELPLEIRKKLRDTQPKVDASLAAIRKLKGLEDASFDAEAMAHVCYPLLKDGKTPATTFGPEAFPQYLDALCALLTKQWKDDMVSEALLEEWKAPHKIELQPEVDLEKEQGKIVKEGKYNAIKLEGGKLIMVQGKGMWRSNMSNIQGIDIVKML